MGHAETAAHLLDHVISRVPVRQWVLSFPIPLRLLFATHPQLLAPVLQIVHPVIDRVRPARIRKRRIQCLSRVRHTGRRLPAPALRRHHRPLCRAFPLVAG